MKKTILAVATLFTMLSLAAAAAENTDTADILERPEPWAEVMLVGTYHFANPGADAFNVEADDIRSEKRQREIAAVTARLAAWKPDLVAVEWPRGEQEEAESRYAEYRDGGLRDRRNEIYQFGFRLADALDHEGVAAVDVQHRFYSEQQAALEEAPDDRYHAIAEEKNQYGNAYIAASQAVMASRSIGDILAWYNAPEALAGNHDFYVRYNIRQWQDENQGGAHTIANWYTRNILIFQNLLREIEESDGQVRRVIVFYGQGHIPILARLIEDTPFLVLADPAPYLADGEE